MDDQKARAHSELIEYPARVEIVRHDIRVRGVVLERVEAAERRVERSEVGHFFWRTLG